MLFFRSEEEIEQWRSQTHEPRGEMISLQQTWTLAQKWYHNRMNLEFSGRTPQEAEQVFAEVGLTSGFWRFGEEEGRS